MRPRFETMSKPREVVRYVEQKTDGNASLHDRGPAFIAKVRLSKTGLRIYFGDKTLQRIRGGGTSGNYVCLEDGDEYWVSGVKKRGTNRHWAGSGDVVLQVTPEELEAALRVDDTA